MFNAPAILVQIFFRTSVRSTLKAGFPYFFTAKTGKPVWIRHVLVPERSDKDEYLHRLHDFIETLDNVEKVEVLPYHTLGVYKWKELGIPYQLEGIDPPSQERVENANRILETAKYHA